MNTIGQQIYEYRKKHELSQKALAELIGIDRSYLVQIENGKRIPGREAAFKIARMIRED
jgi:transcriptional regulator with XRE-family HTH domain